MPTDLYGGYYMAYRDVARKLVTLGAAKPFYGVDMNDNGVRYYNVDTNERVSLNIGGLYAIYREVNGKLEALYSGHSKSHISYRLYRFFKELQNRSRPDETHPGARKAREAGVKPTDRFYIKVLTSNDIPTFKNFYYDMDRVDECIAHLLKTRYNERVIYD